MIYQKAQGVSPENGVTGRDEGVAGQPHLMERLGQGLWWGGLEAAPEDRA